MSPQSAWHSCEGSDRRPRLDSWLCSVLALTLLHVGTGVCVSGEKAMHFSTIRERRVKGATSFYLPQPGACLWGTCMCVCTHTHTCVHAHTHAHTHFPVTYLQLRVCLQLQTFQINFWSLPESCCELSVRKAFKVTLRLSPESKPVCFLSFS